MTSAVITSSGSAPLLSAPFASVNGPTQGPSAGPYEGWSAQYAGTPVVANPDGVSPTQFDVTRQAFDATGNTTTVVERMTVTARVRQPYPSQASNSTNTVALSDYIYSTDTVAGTVTNNSTFTSPKPIANWVTPHRLTIGNTLNIEVEAFHRNARGGTQVACVVFTATDAHSHTATQTVTAMTVSGRARDQNRVLVYAAALDITGLTDGDLITVNAKVYPLVGAVASIADSSDGTWTALKDFSPRYFLKNVSLAASPKFIYVSTTGTDATAVLSTNDTLARANPALTIMGAANVIKAAGVCDGVQVRLMAGSFHLDGPTSGTLTQAVGCITITRDPTVPLANAILQHGSGSHGGFLINSGFTSPITTGALRVTDVSVQRVGAFAIGFGTARLEIIWDNIPWDQGGFGQAYLNAADDYVYGATVTNPGFSFFAQLAAGEHRILRGLTFDSGGVVSAQTITGGKITNADALASILGSTDDGFIISFNTLDAVTANHAWVNLTNSNITLGAVLAQNVLVFTSTTSGDQVGISNDDATNNTTHLILHNNTFAGTWIYGRGNLFYDQGGSARTNKLMSCKGNIFVAVYTKSDVFDTDGSRLGNFAFEYGVGSQGQFTQYQSNGNLGTDQAQIYPGLGASNGTGQTNAATNDPKFTSPTPTLWNGATATAGTVGGVYTLQVSSPCKAMVSNAVLPFDLAGTARPLTADTAGAYI